jgi:hypothetical protein
MCGKRENKISAITDIPDEKPSNRDKHADFEVDIGYTKEGNGEFWQTGS